MRLYFTTKRNTNGHRSYLFVNADNKTFTRQNPWVCKPDDAVEIGKRDMERIMSIFVADRYVELDANEWKSR